VQGVWRNRDESTIRNELGRYYACIDEIDTQIGRVLKKLDDIGELDNTYIVFTSDHGIAVGRHGLQGKQNLYEHSWRVPLIVKGPGVKARSRVVGNVYLFDVLHTFCDLAGIEAPPTNEGISFEPVLHGRKDVIRDVLFGVFSGDSKPGIRCVRKGDWKLIKYEVFESKEPGGLKSRIRRTQLFNLAVNPNELIKEHHDPKVVELTRNKPDSQQMNLAGLPQYADTLKEMEALLLSEQKRFNDPYRFWNQPKISAPR
jgi:arylsulfatase A-like enzyme